MFFGLSPFKAAASRDSNRVGLHLTGSDTFGLASNAQSKTSFHNPPRLRSGFFVAQIFEPSRSLMIVPVKMMQEQMMQHNLLTRVNAEQARPVLFRLFRHCSFSWNRRKRLVQAIFGGFFYVCSLVPYIYIYLRRVKNTLYIVKLYNSRVRESLSHGVI